MGKDKDDKKRKQAKEADEDASIRHKSKKRKKEDAACATAQKHSKSSSEKERIKQAKKFLKQQIKAEAKAAAEAEDTEATAADASAPFEEIGEDNYFQRSTEFSAWLLEHKGKYFNELSAEDSRALFRDFVDCWNRRKLSAKYYKGTVKAPARLTQHNWNLRGGIDTKGDVAIGLAAAVDDETPGWHVGHDRDHAERKRWRKPRKDELDDLAPKATGRERLVEKRIERRLEAKAREESPDLMPGPNGRGIDPMGGTESFAVALAREKAAEERRKQRFQPKADLLTARAAEAQAVEDARMAQFRALVEGGPLEIRKR